MCSNSLSQFKDALVSCCAIGAKLVSLHQSFKFNTIPEALKSIEMIERLKLTILLNFG